MKWFPGVSKTLRLPANQSHRWHFRTAAKPLGNLLIQYSHFVAETSEAMQVTGQVQSDSGQVTKLFTTSPPWISVPAKALTPLPHVMQQNKIIVHVYRWTHVQKNQCAPQHCRGPLCHTDTEGGWSLRTLPPLLVQSSHRALAKAPVPGENADWQPLSQHLLLSRDVQM